MRYINLHFTYLLTYFPDVYRFPDPPVHPVAFSIDHLGMVPVYDMVERNGIVCDCRLVLLCCMWLREMVWSVTADLLCSIAADLLMLRVCALTSHCVTSCWCSCSHTPKTLPVSRLPANFVAVFTWYSHASCCLCLSFGCTSRLLID